MNNSITLTRKLSVLFEPVSIAPLAMVRVLFGGVMFVSMLRFLLKGWVYDLYVRPKFYFPFYGFEWIKPLGEVGMYSLFGLVTVAALLIMLGCYYRLASVLFFLGFTYIELIDKSNYLNHYYFISVVSFLLLFVPAHRYFSLDAWRKPATQLTHVPRWMIDIFQLQLGLVYIFAGIAKLNADWLFQAMPLRIWLPAHAQLPIIGRLLDETWVAYAFSWFGAIYDLTIVLLLANRQTRLVAYFFVVLFHLMTAWLFPIGMFPYIMVLLTLVFFSPAFHLAIMAFLRKMGRVLFSISITPAAATSGPVIAVARTHTWLIILLSLHFLVQLIVPLRYLLYPGKLFWTEQGYRFSWRVMLMEKAGTTFFYVTDPATGRQGEVMTSDFLTPNQEKMMATQPDMILQFAQHLAHYYRKQGIAHPRITAEGYVTLNGRGSRPFIKPSVDLAQETENFAPKTWLVDFPENE